MRPLVGREMPHDVHDVARILGSELDTKLTPDLSVAQTRDLRGWSEIGELHGDILLSRKLEEWRAFPLWKPSNGLPQLSQSFHLAHQNR